MKKSLFSIILSLIFITATSQQPHRDIHPTKKLDANPINVAATLAEKNNSADFSSICEYYGYLQQAPENGYTVFKHPANGSIIRFKFDDTDPNQQFATVEVKSKASQKEKDQILKDLNFQKTSKGYERKSIGFSTHCASGNHGFLILTSQAKPKK